MASGCMFGLLIMRYGRTRCYNNVLYADLVLSLFFFWNNLDCLPHVSRVLVLSLYSDIVIYCLLQDEALAFRAFAWAMPVATQIGGFSLVFHFWGTIFECFCVSLSGVVSLSGFLCFFLGLFF